MNSKTGIAKTGRKKSHRESLQRNLLNDLIVYEYITTTRAKTKLVLGHFDKVVAIATSEKNDREKMKTLVALLHNENAATKVVEVLAKRFTENKTGLVKTYKVGNRKGDNSEMVKLIVKGYVYKEIGKKVSSTTEKKETKKVEKSDDKAVVGVQAQKNLGHKEQVRGAAAGAKVKTRSGI